MSTSRVRRHGMLLVLAALFSATVTSGEAPFHYVRRLGLFDAEHTDGGMQFTELAGMTNEGYIAGISYRYVGGRGQTAWLATPQGRTRRIGLYDGDHASPAGLVLSQPMRVSKSGLIIGTSARRGIGDGTGISSWWVDARVGTTHRLGLFDSVHTAPGPGDDGILPEIPPGTQVSLAWNISESGFIAGTSERYSLPYHPSGAQIKTETGWIADTHGTIRALALSDPEHTFVTARGENIRSSYVSHVSESGLVGGSSTRYAAGYADSDIVNAERGQTAFIADISGRIQRVGLYGGEYSWAGRAYSAIYVLNDAGYTLGIAAHFISEFEGGTAAWYADPAGNTTRVGYYGPGYVSAEGASYNEPYYLTDLGYISGSTYTVNVAGGFSGRTAWIAHVSGGIVQVGLDDEEHRNADGRSSDYIIGMNASGITHGTSERFRGQNVAPAATAWVANPAGTTERIGFYGTAYERPDGWRVSEGWAISDNGYVLGSSARVTPSGSVAWVAKIGAGTRRIGLFDATHTRHDGHQESPSFRFTRSGIAGGASTRYLGGPSALGQTAWIYDTRTARQVVFELSVRPSDGYAHSDIATITEDGRVGGTYRLFSPEGKDLGDRGFIYTPEAGAVDVGANLDRPVSTTSWQSFTSVLEIGANGGIAGYGVPGGAFFAPTQAAYLVHDRRIGPEPEPFDRADVIIDGVHQVYYCPRSALFRYTLTVGNAGPDAASEVVVRDKLPAGMLFYKAHSSRGRLAVPKQWHQGTVTWYLDELGTAPTDIPHLVIWAFAKDSGVFTNRAHAYSATPDDEPDSNRTESSVRIDLDR